MSIYKVGHQRIDGLIPGASGERAFPTQALGYEQRGANIGTDPFVMLDHIGPSLMTPDWRLGGDQGIHPHRGFETLTFMFKGNLRHLDTVFTERPLLTNGSVQQMNAGKGIRHGGDFWADEKTDEFHEIQLWVNNPAAEKMSDPYVRNYSAEQFGSVQKDNVQLRVIAGAYEDQTGPIKTFANIRVLHGVFDSSFGQKEPSSDNVVTIKLEAQHASQLLFVMTGRLKVNDQWVEAGETVVIQNENEISLSGNENSQFLVISGTPLQEPIAFGGPFVMNTKDQIQQAFQDAEASVF
jgi:redox-sensitive bicupin YhaK (pirin superfamily)